MKRISITPIALVGGAPANPRRDFVEIAKTLDKAAKEVGVNFIGGYSALVSKGMTPAEERLIRSIPQALAVTDRVRLHQCRFHKKQVSIWTRYA